MSEEHTHESSYNIIELKRIIKELDIKGARDLIDNYPDADIAASVETLELNEQLTFLRLLTTASAASIYSYLDEDTQVELAKSFTEEWGMKLLQELQSDELVDVLDELPANVASKVLAYTNSEKRSELNKLLSYNDDEVGSIMSIDISSLPNSYTCEQALNKIRRDYNKNKKELVHYYYVINNTNQLLGALTLEEIAFANPNDKIDDIYSPVAYVFTSEKKENAAKIFSEHDMSVLPVVNHEKRLIGMITSDDVIDVIQEEVTEDLYKMAGINKKAAESEYIKTPWYKIVQSRILWLSILLLLSTVTQIIIHWTLSKVLTNQDKTIASNTAAGLTIAFAAIIPVLGNATSNVGMQSNISISRALALHEIEKKDFGKVIWKELLVGLVIGIVLFAINFARLGIYFSASKDLLGTQKVSYLAIIAGTSIALLVVSVLTSLFGVLFPIILVKAKKDPSSVSAVLINVITDILTVLVTFAITYGVILATL
ncbi:magnesium transporter [Mycoplasmopsis primatum]|uniref:magnesium transporter n=1 Tax=Mycoplasmopsis primatum TaxID=55604 RepID=UPI00049831A8|nr:magnesium transporter [Mycoplasmopsis primatum]